MPKTFQPAGTKWQGLIAADYMDPTDIPPDASPDCANAYFWEGTLNLLGPRLGKVLAGNAQQTIVGAYGYHVNGLDGLLVSTADGITRFVPNTSGGYGAIPTGGSLNPPSTTQVNSTTVNIGPLQMIFNQFNQFIGGNWNNGNNGITGILIFSIPVFNSSNCTETYTKFTCRFTNGLLMSVTVETAQATSTNSWTAL